MKLVIIGSGNVATILGRLSLKAGHQVLQVYSTNHQHASTLASELNAVVGSGPLDSMADLCLIAIKDSALEELSTWLKFNNQLLAHTAGSVSIKVLKNASSNYGVVYPLQSLRKENAEPLEIPILIDANNSDNLLILKTFAQSISDTVYGADDSERKKIHLAATIANNFSNYLYTLTEAYCQKEGIDFKLLLPIIQETSHRLEKFSPSEMQTGPGIRGDRGTMLEHLRLLKRYPKLSKLYQQFSEQIEQYYRKKTIRR